MNNRSFTLIELLVVIVIIGILAGVIMISTSSSIDKANFAKAQAFSSTVQNSLLSNLVSEWLFDNALIPGEDTWANNDGIVNGAIYRPSTSGECVFGGCMSFTTNDVNITSAVLNLTDFTFSVWAKGTGTIIGSGRNEGWPRYWALTHNSFSFRPVAGNTTIYSASLAGISSSEWHYIIITRNSSILTTYVDGKQSGQNTSFTNSSLISYNDWGQFIGKIKQDTAEWTGTNYFSGKIDDVAIYNVTLSSSQIKQNYIAGLDSLLNNGNISKEDYNNRLNKLAYIEYE